MMPVSLATDLGEPRDRLRAICTSAQSSKEIVAELGTATPDDVRFFGLPGLLRSAIMSKTLIYKRLTVRLHCETLRWLLTHRRDYAGIVRKIVDMKRLAKATITENSRVDSLKI